MDTPRRRPQALPEDLRRDEKLEGVFAFRVFALPIQIEDKVVENLGAPL